jgi:hypothetical protein
VKATTLTRIARLRARIGTGCPMCKRWPLVYFLTDADPTPATTCDRCGRRFAGLVRLYVGADPDAV